MKQWVQKLVSLLVQQPDWQLGLLMGLQSVQLSVKRLDLLSGLQTVMLWALLMEQQLDSRLVLLLEATVADAVGLTVGIASVGDAVDEADGTAVELAVGVGVGAAIGPDVGAAAAVGLAVGSQMVHQLAMQLWK